MLYPLPVWALMNCLYVATKLFVSNSLCVHVPRSHLHPLPLHAVVLLVMCPRTHEVATEGVTM